MTQAIVTETEYNYLNKPIKTIQRVRKGDLIGNAISDDQETTLVTTYTYDKNGNLEKTTTPDLLTTTYTYDTMDRVLTSYLPAKDEYGVAKTVVTSDVQYTWDGKVSRQKDAKGNETQFYYDARGLLTKTINALGGVTFMSYDRGGRARKSVRNYEQGNYEHEFKVYFTNILGISKNTNLVIPGYYAVEKK